LSLSASADQGGTSPFGWDRPPFLREMEADRTAKLAHQVGWPWRPQAAAMNANGCTGSP